ncbi:potassium transporter Kup [Phenylobacterium montanum]|uniref:Probable potassium transport system protein Kup n=1 Tax=Phenylobacterium montanum TaxID=2823693 RepID=A0A975IT70_9CAUL|nr:potassium transporter Kup [Caulobacter sp. S6]QUD86174.1 potassium transporter Kup [Caulobacter sp. S6]
MPGELPVAAQAAEPTAQAHSSHAPDAHGGRFWSLALGAIGVVFGDIGTSPLYAFRQALKQATGDGHVQPEAVYGVVSLALWALIMVVTVKYVIFLMRADNKGEGGVLSLTALAQHVNGRRTLLVFAFGVIGAALFYGDSIITPAISVLSAIEGLQTVPALQNVVTPGGGVVIVLSLLILTGLFAVQFRGTANVAIFFGPVLVCWFALIAAFGVMHIVHEPGVLLAASPSYAVMFLARHGMVSLMVLGSVFLTVTGAEALYADMGHFGRWPIQAAWLFLALPCLMLNYLGQGAFALQMVQATHGQVQDMDWFFQMTPVILRVPMVVLATAATVIASQAVITGAFSLTNQAMQLGLLPRMVVKRTSATQAGQIYLPQINGMLAVGVVLLIAVFKSSDALGQAYGLAVTGTMAVTTSLSFIVVRKMWRWPLIGALALIGPLLTMDLFFLGANSLKIFSGAALPLVMGAALFLVMATWVRGNDILAKKLQKDTPPLDSFLGILRARPPHRVTGTAVYLTSDPAHAPAALLHNLKHNRVLHQQNIILSVETLETPRAPEEQRVSCHKIDDDFTQVTVRYGFMETPNIPKALAACRSQGLLIDMMSTSFFLGRKTVVATSRKGLGQLQDRLYILLAKNAANPTDFFQIPPGRVLEMGAQLSI